MLHYESTALTRPRDAYLAPRPRRYVDCVGLLQPRRRAFRLRGDSPGRRDPWNPFRFSLS
jgi:hypothetical protein